MMRTFAPLAVVTSPRSLKRRPTPAKPSSARAIASGATPSCQPTAAAASAFSTLCLPGSASTTSWLVPCGRRRVKRMRDPSCTTFSARTSACGLMP
ncbi:hypothetical protein G6F65_021367 [Rhizopus arrhizus]|uniref:Uncharacterized protein n=1 Tax=Rhizopus delemar TaxID=936053 RepID=A0A9P6XR61_9FUNG|nr:hypothetical protein G6F65_021367 [Rhizopus arrhizus]KAG1530552.1 hypothetical protein G6F50_017239 [Rhizopus delemar]